MQCSHGRVHSGQNRPHAHIYGRSAWFSAYPLDSNAWGYYVLPVARLVDCMKLNRELEGMPYRPFDNELGTRIYEHVSFEAWRMWLEHSKMIVNEYRLDLTSQRSHDMLLEQCEEFFFGEGASLPPDFVAPPSK